MKLVKVVVAGVVFAIGLSAQFRPSGWLTFGGDPQRTGWAKAETELTRENVKKLKLEWTLKLDNAPKEFNALTAPVVSRTLITPRGFKELAIIAGSSDKLFAIDSDTGKVYWQKTLPATEPPGGPPRRAHWLCPNALNATPTIAPVPAPPSATPAAAAAPARPSQAAYVIASDGKLHAYHLISGEPVFPPVQFVPPLAKVWSLNYLEGVLYTTTSQGCGGVNSGVWSLDLNNPNFKVNKFFVTNSRPGGAGIWGRAGAAITSDGKIVVETGDGNYDAAKNDFADSVVALSKDLKLVDYYTPTNRGWITKKDLDMGNISPVVFKFKSWELVAASGKEGVIYLLDSKSLGGADHRTPLYRSPLYSNEEVNFAARGFWGALSTWEDSSGTRWLYAPAWGPPTPDTKFAAEHGPTPNGSVMAFKVELKDNQPVLVPAWKSRDMAVPTPVIIANGMVFAISDGDNASQSGPNGGVLSSPQRLENVGRAVLYVFDAATGETLFSSGDTIKSFSHFSAPVVASGRVYATTYDSTVYAFSLGPPSER